MGLWGLIALLVVVWLISVVLKFTLGGLIHILLLVAVGILVYRLVKGVAT